MKQPSILLIDWQPYFVGQGPVSNRAEKEREVMRLYDCFRAIPQPLIKTLTANQIKTAFQVNLPEVWIRGAHRRFLDHLETQEKNMETTQEKVYDPKKHLSPDLLIDRVATIVAKSYAVKGDDEEIASEDALKMIKTELQKYDEKIIARNGRKSLAKIGK
jgi:hypothetical protein